MSIEPGHDLLHYRITEKIGEGGMGVVWRAEHTTLGGGGVCSLRTPNGRLSDLAAYRVTTVSEPSSTDDNQRQDGLSVAIK